MQYESMKKHVMFGALLALTIATFPLQAGGITLPDGLSQVAADGLYVRQDGSLDPDMTGNLAISVAGQPLTAKNTTDTSEYILFELYGARGAGFGVDDDAMLLNFRFDDNSTNSIPVRIRAVINDADPKGGTFGSFLFQAGSVTPKTIFNIDGLNNLTSSPFFSVCDEATCAGDELLTGMDGGENLVRIKMNNLGIADFTLTQFVISDRNLVIDEKASVTGGLAVGSPVASIPASSIAHAVSTTKGITFVPSMTNAQMLAIGSPVQGLLVEDSTNNALNRHNGTGFDAVSVNVPTIKSGTVAGPSFAGNPKIFTVTFGTAFPDTNYAVTITAEDNRTFTFQTKLAASFVMNSNANLALVGDVDWTATAHNDP